MRSAYPSGSAGVLRSREPGDPFFGTRLPVCPEGEASERSVGWRKCFLSIRIRLYATQMGNP